MSPPFEELARHKQQVASTRAQWQWCSSKFHMRMLQDDLQPLQPPLTRVPTIQDAKQYLVNLVNPDFHACDHICPTFRMYTHCPVLMQQYARGYPVFIMSGGSLNSNQKVAVYQGKLFSL